MAIAKSLATAAVGDKVWVCDPYNRGEKWTLRTVAKVARVYLYVEGYHGELGEAFDRATGSGKPQAGYTPRTSAYGSDGRTALTWDNMRWDLASRIRECRNNSMIRDVAFALGVPEPPDYSVEP